jgi:hypothetical protein
MTSGNFVQARSPHVILSKSFDAIDSAHHHQVVPSTFSPRPSPTSSRLVSLITHKNLTQACLLHLPLSTPSTAPTYDLRTLHPSNCQLRSHRLSMSKVSYQSPSVRSRIISFSGHPLYMASSVFVRHTLNALYSHLRVELRKISVNTPSTSDAGPSNAHISPQTTSGAPSRRQKSIFIGLRVRGNARVSGGPGQWDV